ncbi:MAG TPA: helix-turn-helix transcriptional regulator [Parasegetibacter sp.]|jgi:transcriptional regulator with XRE-family HTH domain
MSLLSKNLAYLRKQLKLRQEEMQSRVGVSRTTWSNYENGISEPSVNGLINISNFFGVSLDDLLKKDLSRTANSKGNPAPVRYGLNNAISVLDEDDHLLDNMGITDIISYLKMLTTEIRELKRKIGVD